MHLRVCVSDEFVGVCGCICVCYLYLVVFGCFRVYISCVRPCVYPSCVSYSYTTHQVCMNTHVWMYGRVCVCGFMSAKARAHVLVVYQRIRDGRCQKGYCTMRVKRSMSFHALHTTNTTVRMPAQCRLGMYHAMPSSRVRLYAVVWSVRSITTPARYTPKTSSLTRTLQC